MRPAGCVSTENVPQASGTAFAGIRHSRQRRTPKLTLILARSAANPGERGDREARAGGAFFPASGRGAGAPTRLRRRRAALTSASDRASPPGRRAAADAGAADVGGSRDAGGSGRRRDAASGRRQFEKRAAGVPIRVRSDSPQEERHTPALTLILARTSANPSERGDREARAGGAFFPASGRGAGAPTRLRRRRAALTSASDRASPPGRRAAADAGRRGRWRISRRRRVGAPARCGQRAASVRKTCRRRPDPRSQ